MRGLLLATLGKRVVVGAAERSLGMTHQQQAVRRHAGGACPAETLNSFRVSLTRSVRESVDDIVAIELHGEWLRLAGQGHLDLEHIRA